MVDTRSDDIPNVTQPEPTLQDCGSEFTTERVAGLPFDFQLSAEETAEVMGISPETVKCDWRKAKAWLFGALTGERDHTSS